MNPTTLGNPAASIREILRQSARSLAAPGEDADTLQSSFDRHLDQMAPRTEFGLSLVFRIFTLMLRLRRFVENEARALAAKGVAHDDSPEAAKARKDEAATSRELFKVLREFRLAEAAFAKGPGQNLDPTSCPETACRELGSFRKTLDGAHEAEGVAEPETPTGELGSFCTEVVEAPSVVAEETPATVTGRQETSIELGSSCPETSGPKSAIEVTASASFPVASIPQGPPPISFLDPNDPPRSVGWNGYFQF